MFGNWSSLYQISLILVLYTFLYNPLGEFMMCSYEIKFVVHSTEENETIKGTKVRILIDDTY